jgi:hypothetical protein
VVHVRSLVIDVLSPEQLRRLGLVADHNLFVQFNLNSAHLMHQVFAQVIWSAARSGSSSET